VSQSFFFSILRHFLILFFVIVLFKISDLIWASTIGKIDSTHGFIL